MARVAEIVFLPARIPIDMAVCSAGMRLDAVVLLVTETFTRRQKHSHEQKKKKKLEQKPKPKQKLTDEQLERTTTQGRRDFSLALEP